ncbi:MAG TPA: carboxymuconolactone decarboxylase family protein [Pseudomonadales bacterium]
MSWRALADAPTPVERVLGLRPELLAGYRRFYRTLWRSGTVPRRILELTRLRIAAIHDCEAEWAVRDRHAGVDAAELDALRRGDDARFSAAERAALAVAEQMPYAHH